MLLNKRGAALLQVLVVAAILAGMSAMILRVTLSRQITSRQTRHTIAAQSAIEACMAEVNTLWAAKTPTAYARDLAKCQMCDATMDAGQCSDDSYGTDFPFVAKNKAFKCTVQVRESSPVDVDVWAVMESGEGSNFPCKMTYTVINGRDL